MTPATRIFLALAALGTAGGMVFPDGPRALGRLANETRLDLTHRLFIEGEPGEEGEFPFVAALGSKAGDSFLHSCGGSLLDLPIEGADGRWILTAAHCAQYRTVVLGKTSVRLPLAELEPLMVERPYCHAGYQQDPTQHDLALLKLKDPVDGEGLPLPKNDLPLTENDLDNGSITMAGWADGGILKHAKVRMKSIASCRNDLEKSPIVVDETVFCTWKLGSGGGVTEQDDSGGPAIADGVLVGVIFAGDNAKKPDVHLNLAHYRDWIHGVVSGDESETDNCGVG